MSMDANQYCIDYNLHYAPSVHEIRVFFFPLEKQSQAARTVIYSSVPLSVCAAVLLDS